jgi:hypothetical protein
MERIASLCLWAAALGAAAIGPAAAAQAASGGPESAYLIVEDSWVYGANEPGLYLDHAREDLRQGRSRLAATDVRRAAALIAAEAKRAGVDDRGRLQRDARSLLQVAARIDAGSITKARRFDLAVVMTRADLGAYHHLRAADAWARKDTTAAGRALVAEARDVEGAFITLDNKLTSDSTQGLQTVQAFGERLASHAGAALDSEWSHARSTMDQALATLQRKMEVHPAGS